MFPKPVDESQANDSDVKDQDAANMGDTGVEGLSLLLCRSDAHNCLKDQNIREEDNQSIQEESQSNQNDWVYTIECNISTGKFHDILVEAKGMGKNMGTEI